MEISVARFFRLGKRLLGCEFRAKFRRATAFAIGDGFEQRFHLRTPLNNGSSLAQGGFGYAFNTSQLGLDGFNAVPALETIDFIAN